MPEEFISEVTEEPSNISDDFTSGSIEVKQVDVEMADLNEKIKESAKRITDKPIQLDSEPVGKSLKWSLTDGSKSVEIKVKNAKGEVVNYGDAITDPSVEPKEVTKGFVEAAKELGMSIPDDMARNMDSRVANNPRRIGNTAKEVSESKPEVKTAVEADKPLMNGDVAYDKAVKSGNTAEIERLSKENEKLVEKNKEVAKLNENLKDLKEKIDKMSEPEKKSWAEKVSEGAWSLAKLAALIAAGYLTYEMIKGYQHEISGCWQVTSTGNSNSKQKIGTLTCDSCCKNTTSPDTVCDPCNQPKGAQCACGDCTAPCDACKTATPPVPCSNPKDCKCGSSCESDEGTLCSKWCDNTVRILKDSKGNTYAYYCREASFSDAIADIAGNAANAASNIIDTGGDLFKSIINFFKNVLKYGIWIALAIGAGFLLYYGYKFVSPMLHKKGDETAGKVESGHADTNIHAVAFN